MNIIDHIKNKFWKEKQEDNKQDENLKNKDEKPSIFFPDKPFGECINEANNDEEAKELFNILKKQINSYDLTRFEIESENSIVLSKRMVSYKNKIEKFTNSIIEKNPNVLFLVEDEHKQNLGMMLAKVGMEDVVLKILDNPYLGNMQDDEGKNIGMIAAENGLNDAVIKALDNSVASIQKDKIGRNIGMYCANQESCNSDVIIKALENNKASLQQDIYGYNMGMLAVMYHKDKALFEKVLENTDACMQQDRDGYNIGMYIAKKISGDVERASYEDLLIKALDNEFASMQQDGLGKNLGMHVALQGFKKATLKALDNLVASNQQDKDGFNIGMVAAINIQDDEVDFKALSNPVASVQQTSDGNNIGMLIAKNFAETRKGSFYLGKMRNPEVLIYALQNKEASIQQSKYGYNIGMFVASNENVPECVISFALKNKEASVQQNQYGKNIGMIVALHDGSVDLILEAMENEEAVKQESFEKSTILSICEDKGRNDVFFEIFKRGLDDKPIFKQYIKKVEDQEKQSWKLSDINLLENNLDILMRRFDINTKQEEADTLSEVDSVMEE